MPRLFYALDLHDEPVLIDEYDRWHQADRVWPDILQSLRAAGSEEAEIFRTGNRLVLVLDVSAEFDSAAKAAADTANTRVQAGETLMWNYQKALRWAGLGENWIPMRRVFSFTEWLQSEKNPAAP